MIIQLYVVFAAVILFLALGWLPYLIFLLRKSIRTEAGIKMTKRDDVLSYVVKIWLNIASIIAIILSVLSVVTMTREAEISVEEYRISSVENKKVYLENAETGWVWLDNIRVCIGEERVKLSEDAELSDCSVTVRTKTKQAKFLFLTVMDEQKEYLLYIQK